MITPADAAELDAIGLDATPHTPTRSAWPAERVLQIAGDGAIVAPDLVTYDGENLDVVVDGRPITDPEGRALIDLLSSGCLDWRGSEITLTDRGERLLRRWSSLVPMMRRHPR